MDRIGFTPSDPAERAIRSWISDGVSGESGIFPDSQMVGLAQLVERQVVVLDVTGSSPVAHPNEEKGREYITHGLFLFM